MESLRAIWFQSYPYGLYAAVFAMSYALLTAASWVTKRRWTEELGWQLIIVRLPLKAFSGLSRLRCFVARVFGDSYGPRCLPPWMVDVCESRLFEARSDAASSYGESEVLRTLVDIYAPRPPWPRGREHVAKEMVERGAWFAAQLAVVERDASLFGSLIRRFGDEKEVRGWLGPTGGTAADLAGLVAADPIQRARACASLVAVAQAEPSANWPALVECVEAWCEERLQEQDYHGVERLAVQALANASPDGIGVVASILVRTYGGLAERCAAVCDSEVGKQLAAHYQACAARYRSLAESAGIHRGPCSHPALYRGGL